MSDCERRSTDASAPVTPWFLTVLATQSQMPRNSGFVFDCSCSIVLTYLCGNRSEICRKLGFVECSNAHSVG